MQHEPAARPVRDISILRRGDRIEARRGVSASHIGQVKDTAPGLGMIWIHEEGRRGRKAVSADDFSIYRLAGRP